MSESNLEPKQEDVIKDEAITQEPEGNYILNGDYLVKLEEENLKLTEENNKLKDFIIEKLVLS